MLSTGSRHRRGPWPNEVVDQDSGLNMMFFPSYDSSGISCIELVDEADELVGLLHFGYGIWRGPIYRLTARTWASNHGVGD